MKDKWVEMLVICSFIILLDDYRWVDSCGIDSGMGNLF